MTRVYEVNTVERVERRYLIEFTDQDVAEDLGIPVSEVTDEERVCYAEERITSGEDVKFTEGNADIDEVISTREVTEVDGKRQPGFNEYLSRWKTEYGGGWSEMGLGPTAEGYACVVIEQRLGERRSLSYGYALATGRQKDATLRRQLRAQVDVIMGRA